MIGSPTILVLQRTEQSTVMTTRHLLIPAGMLLALLLTACAPPSAPTPEGPDMTPDDVKAQLMDLYEASATDISPDGWELQGSWLDCSPSSDDLRVRWNLAASRTAPLPGPPAELITQAQKAWQERGHEVDVERDTNLTPPRWILSDPPLPHRNAPRRQFLLS